LLRSALNLLGQERILSMAKSSDDLLGRRVAQTMVRLTLETGAEHSRLMYLLRFLGPEIIEDANDRARLDAVVANRVEGARRVSASNAADYVQALIVAPAVSGRDGVVAALDALAAILKDASRERVSLSAASAYDPLLQLAYHHKAIAQGAGLDPADLLLRMQELEAPIVELWRRAVERPALFNGFVLPEPTEPNRVIVHNWTFASLAFANAIGRQNAIGSALAAAEATSALRDAMRTARAVRIAVDGNAFDIGKMAEQSRAAFYAALGERLVLLDSISPEERAKVLPALVERCLKLGPSGLDTGVFTAAIHHGVSVDRSPWLEGYRVRVRADASLRHAMVPLLERLVAEPVETGS
jgi:hypothetical protein